MFEDKKIVMTFIAGFATVDIVEFSVTCVVA